MPVHAVAIITPKPDRVARVRGSLRRVSS
jgi:hypothetical protein